MNTVTGSSGRTRCCHTSPGWKCGSISTHAPAWAAAAAWPTRADAQTQRQLEQHQAASGCVSPWEALSQRPPLACTQRAQQRVHDAMHVVQRQRVQDAVILLPLPRAAQHVYHGRQAAVRVQRACGSRRAGARGAHGSGVGAGWGWQRGSPTQQQGNKQPASPRATCTPCNSRAQLL